MPRTLRLRAHMALACCGLLSLLTAAQPAHAISPGQQLYADVLWVGLSLRGVLSQDGLQWGPAAEVGLHPVQTRTMWGQPAWMDEEYPDPPLNDRAVSLSAWRGLWGKGPDALSVSLSAHWFISYYPDYHYTPSASAVVGWLKVEDQSLATLGGTLSAGAHLNSVLEAKTGLVFPQGTMEAGVRLGPDASSSGGWMAGYAASDLTLRVIRRGPML